MAGQVGAARVVACWNDAVEESGRAARQRPKDKWGSPVLVPPPSDATVAFPDLTMQILAYNLFLSTEKRKKCGYFARGWALDTYVLGIMNEEL